VTAILSIMAGIACTIPSLLAATSQEVAATVRRQIAAKPADGPRILNRNLSALPETQRSPYAASALAAALEGVEKNSDRVIELYAAAVKAAPRAVLSLMEVAHRAAPDRIVEITRIALESVPGLRHGDGKEILSPDGKAVAVAGGPDTRQDGLNASERAAAAILAKALALAPGQQLALTQLVAGMFPGALGARIIELGLGFGRNGIVLGNEILGHTINPANIGGGQVLAPDTSVVSPEQ
jgi:hypothetical protein